MYRAQDIGTRDQLVQRCVKILEHGRSRSLYAILPHICLVRSPGFLPPLLKLLRCRQRSRQQFAAMALGAIGDPCCIDPLLETFMHRSTFRGSGTRSLQTAIIFALGETADDRAVDPLLQIYHLRQPRDRFFSTRKRLVITALGTLTQQNAKRAERALAELMDSRQASLRAQAVTEMGVAYWHTPTALPQPILQRFFDLARDRSQEVRNAALSALFNLAQLGSDAAEVFLAGKEGS